MRIRQFPYLADNLGYLIWGERHAMAVDGGAVKDILSAVDSLGLILKYVTNTHLHPDHTVGTRALVQESGAEYLDNKTLLDNKTIDLDGEELQVYHTPGHSKESVCFHFGNVLVAGDTLFNGKVGRCFSRDLKSFYTSIKFLTTLPGNTVVYAGHDYVGECMEFVRQLDPDNRHIDRFLKRYDPHNVHSTLEEELSVNPFLRLNDSGIITILEQRGLPTETEYDRWQSLMGIMEA